MQTIYLDIHDDIYINHPLIACIGYFDGLHIGHQALIKKTKGLKKDGYKTALITFYPDPYEVINEGKSQGHIQDFDSRLKIIETYDIDYCIVFKFSKELANLEHHLFLKGLINKLNLKTLVCGYDFTYGFKGVGNIHTLKEDAKGLFDAEVIDEIKYEEIKVSSTRIRRAINDGNMPLATNLLGYDYFIRGKVIHGLGNGHRINFPTANIEFDNEIVLPRPAVYGGYIKIDDEYYEAMINYGTNPTVNKDNNMHLEVHIIDFEKDLYGHEVFVFFKSLIREEKGFKSLGELKNQLLKDKEYIRENLADGNFIL